MHRHHEHPKAHAFLRFCAYAATVSGSRAGTRSRSFGATCSMNSRIERNTFSRVAHFFPVTINSVPKPPEAS